MSTVSERRLHRTKSPVHRRSFDACPRPLNEALPRVEVVTAFLRRAGKVLLVRRSGRVGSYRGRWAGVSGYLEKTTPLAQALREIGEETGLEPADLHLTGRATPLEIPAPELSRVWIVHPFLFDVDAPAAVRLDWESSECAWVEPSRLDEYETVPMLSEALQACLRNEREQLGQ